VRRDDPNREYLLVVADAIGDLCNEVVFVGGSVAGLLLTDPIADGIRATKDVDAVVEATNSEPVSPDGKTSVSLRFQERCQQ
jgi:hypothetical protein